MENYIFDPKSLNPNARKEGISAFLRVRNGEDFVQFAIESHISFFDEIVAVYNQCTDSTPQILYTLQEKYPDKLKVYHYEPRVYPPGSKGHRENPADSIHSFVNYSNYALSKTTYKIVTRIDDDHIAIPINFSKIVNEIRKNGLSNRAVIFSGLNLMKCQFGILGVYFQNPMAGNGDHWFFPVNKQTFFTHHSRVEVLRFPTNFTIVYGGILYFHLKLLKKDHGCSNYELNQNPDSPYAKGLEKFLKYADCMPVELYLKYLFREKKCNLCSYKGIEYSRLQHIVHDADGIIDAFILKILSIT